MNREPNKENTHDTYLSHITRTHLRPTMMLIIMAILGIFIGSGISPAIASASPAAPVADAQATPQFVLPDGMDANSDGVVTHAEYMAFFDSQFTQMDANHDGKITQKEFLAGIAAQLKAHPPALPSLPRSDP